MRKRNYDLILGKFASFVRVKPTNKKRLIEAYNNLAGWLVVHGGILVAKDQIKEGRRPTIEEIREEQRSLKLVMEGLAQDDDETHPFEISYSLVTDGTNTEAQLHGEHALVRALLLVMQATNARPNICPGCEKLDFKTTSAGRYCGNKCRVAGYRKRLTPEEREEKNRQRRAKDKERRKK